MPKTFAYSYTSNGSRSIFRIIFSVKCGDDILRDMPLLKNISFEELEDSSEFSLVVMLGIEEDCIISCLLELTFAKKTVILCCSSEKKRSFRSALFFL